MQEVTEGRIRGIVEMPDHLLLKIISESGAGNFLLWTRIGFTNYAIHLDDIITWSVTYVGFENHAAWLSSPTREIPVLLWFLGVETQMRVS